MGLAARIVFLSSLFLGLLFLVVLAWSALEIYRTLRYAQKDAAAWAKGLGDRADGVQATLASMQERAADLSQAAQDIHATCEDIADTWADLRSHPAIRAAGFIGRHRR